MKFPYGDYRLMGSRDVGVLRAFGDEFPVDCLRF